MRLDTKMGLHMDLGMRPDKDPYPDLDQDQDQDQDLDLDLDRDPALPVDPFPEWILWPAPEPDDHLCWLAEYPMPTELTPAQLELANGRLMSSGVRAT